MTKTIEEVERWLDSMVNTTPIDKSDQQFNGQCVSLIKVLLDFLGVPNPYDARGNAKDYTDALLSQGIAKPGAGKLNVHINRNGGGGYGHIWVTIGGTLWQSNYIWPIVTKNTPQDPITDTVNLDQWLGTQSNSNTEEEEMKYVNLTSEGDYYGKKYAKGSVLWVSAGDGKFGRVNNPSNLNILYKLYPSAAPTDLSGGDMLTIIQELGLSPQEND